MTQTYDTLQEAEDAFYEALEEGDLSQLLAVWAESNDSCCLLPMYPMYLPGCSQRVTAWHWPSHISAGYKRMKSDIQE